MMSKTFLLLLAMLVACSYAAAPVSGDKDSSIQTSAQVLDEDISSNMLPLSVERVAEENEEMNVDLELDTDRMVEGLDDKVTERINHSPRCWIRYYRRCYGRRKCCCRATSIQRRRCDSWCRRRASRICG